MNSAPYSPSRARRWVMSELKYKGLTLDEIRSCITYDPEEGKIYWKSSTARQYSEGMRAGTKTRRGYRCVTIKGSKFPEHHIAWLMYYGEMPKQLDHINGVRDDNRITNLRVANTSNNCQNSYRKPGNSGIRGVSPSGCGDWVVRVWAFGKKYYLGTYKDIELAELVALEGRQKLHGEFTYENRC